MKVQLVKSETKETFGKEPFQFFYYHRPLTVEEKFKIRANIEWKKGKSKYLEPDFSKFSPFELLDIAITKIEGLNDSDDGKIGTIAELKGAQFEGGIGESIITSMWMTVYIAISLTEELKKKLSEGSTPGATE